MMLRIGKRTFDYWSDRLRSIEHRDGLVALVPRHAGDEVEVLDVVVTDDMNRAAQRFVDQGRSPNPSMIAMMERMRTRGTVTP